MCVCVCGRAHPTALNVNAFVNLALADDDYATTG